MVETTEQAGPAELNISPSPVSSATPPRDIETRAVADRYPS